MELKNKDIKDYLDLTDKLEPNVILETVKFIQDTQLLTDKEKKEISIFFKDIEIRPKEFLVLKSLESSKVKVIALYERTDGIIVEFEIYFKNETLKIDYLFSTQEMIKDSRKKRNLTREISVSEFFKQIAPTELMIISTDEKNKITKVRSFRKNMYDKNPTNIRVKGTWMSQVYKDDKTYSENFFTGELFEDNFLNKAKGVPEEELIMKTIEVLIKNR